ncbi:MAG: prolipoprotein diacylglyceryl transferase [Polyangiales bacterium]
MPLPYIEPRPIPLGPLSLPPFGMLVASGVLLGSYLGVRHASKIGVSRAKLESFTSYILAFGFILSHVFDVLMYRPRDALRDPMELLRIWNGISSYGGFMGCLVGAFVWKAVKKEKILPYSDMCAAVFPVGWIFGRAGCSVAHDHPGRLSDSSLAVDFPAGLFYPPGPRFDLGLLEMLLTIPIAIATLWFARKPRRAGAITGFISVLYAPVRFCLDFYRATDLSGSDARYLGLTPAQWLSIALLAVGIWLLVRSKNQPIVGRKDQPTPSPLAATSI